MTYTVIRRHGYGAKAKYLRIKSYPTKEAAVRVVLRYPREGYKVVATSKLKRTRHPYLYEVKA